MSDADDSDEEDLWADFDNEEETTIAVSENLRDTVSHDLAPVHQGDVDEGKVTWESPIAPGLQNSLKVTEGHDKHWYHEETKAAPSQTPGGAAPANPIAGPSSVPEPPPRKSSPPAVPIVPAVPTANSAMSAPSPLTYPVL